MVRAGKNRELKTGPLKADSLSGFVDAGRCNGRTRGKRAPGIGTRKIELFEIRRCCVAYIAKAALAKKWRHLAFIDAECMLLADGLHCPP